MPSFALSSTTSTAEGIFGADPTPDASSSSSTSSTSSSSSAVEGLFGTSTVPSTSPTHFGSILTATNTPESSSGTASGVLFPGATTAPTLDTQASQSSSSTPSSSSSTPAPAAAPSSTSSHSGLSGGALAATIIVPVVVVALLTMVALFLFRRRQRHRNQSLDNNNENMFGPEVVERSTDPTYASGATGGKRASGGLWSRNEASHSHAETLPWPLAINPEVHYSANSNSNSNTNGGQMQERQPKHQGSRPSITDSNPFGDSRAPSTASQHLNTNNNATNTNPAAPTQPQSAAKQAESGLLAPQPAVIADDPRSPGRPRTAKTVDDDAVSAISEGDVEIGQAQVGVARRVSVMKMGHGMGGGSR